MEALEQMGQIVGGNSDAGVADAHFGEAAVFGDAQIDADLPGEGEFERIRKKIQNDLLPHVAVHIGRPRQRRRVDAQRQPGAFDRRPEEGGEFGGEGREVDGFERGLDPAGLDPRKVEQRIDEAQQSLAVAVRDLDERARSRREARRRLVQEIFERTQHQGERRPELVGHIGEKRRLGAIDLGERLRPASGIPHRRALRRSSVRSGRRRGRGKTDRPRRAPAGGSPPRRAGRSAGRRPASESAGSARDREERAMRRAAIARISPRGVRPVRAGRTAPPDLAASRSPRRPRRG